MPDDLSLDIGIVRDSTLATPPEYVDDRCLFCKAGDHAHCSGVVWRVGDPVDRKCECTHPPAVE